MGNKGLYTVPPSSSYAFQTNFVYTSAYVDVVDLQRNNELTDNGGVGVKSPEESFWDRILELLGISAGLSFLQELFGIIIAVVVLVVLAPFLPAIINFLIWLILLPVRIIKGIVKGLKPGRNRI